MTGASGSIGGATVWRLIEAGGEVIAGGHDPDVEMLLGPPGHRASRKNAAPTPVIRTALPDTLTSVDRLANDSRARLSALWSEPELPIKPTTAFRNRFTPPWRRRQDGRLSSQWPGGSMR